MKKALITGICGQDGSYLAEYLLSLGYEVWGLVRREAGSMHWLEPILHQIELVYGDLRDAESLGVAFQKAWPDEVYNLAGQVFVPPSWDFPAETFDINSGGPARLLQIIQRRKPATRFYQASTSEMVGNFQGACNEEIPLRPTSPYGVSKLAAHRLVEVYRARQVFAVGGILFNHESPRRGPEMVTRKITRAAAAWVLGDRTRVRLGNLEARRDWGFAGDYVRAMHAMLQLPAPKDYVIGTGVSHSVRDFLNEVLVSLHELGAGEAAPRSLEDWVEVDRAFFRRGEINDLRADARLAREELGWTPSVDFKQLVRMMVAADLEAARWRQGTVATQAAPDNLTHAKSSLLSKNPGRQNTLVNDAG